MKTVCVTGTDRGLGLALVKELLHRGYTVFAGRYGETSEALDTLQGLYGEKLHSFPLDVSSDTSVKSAAAILSGLTSGLDLLINNAAILGNIHAVLGEELDFQEMQQVINVNSLGPLRVTNALYPLLLKGEKKLVVNISSEAGSIQTCYRKAWFGYCTSKAALNMTSAVIHNNLRERGGQVLLIHPGWVRTFMQGHLDSAADLTPEESASHILSVIADHEKYKGAIPAYVDYLGNRMEW